MKTAFLTAAVLAAAAIVSPALAAGYAAQGKDDFKRCRACHAIVAPDGATLEKGGKVGPNLYGIIGRAAGSVEGFAYSDSLKTLGANGLVWSEADLATYLTDPLAFARDRLDDPKAKTKMTFKVTDGSEADLAAYLASLAPAP
jgi:cytochrome c